MMYFQIFPAISKMFSALFEFRTMQVKKQSETDVLRDKCGYKKALNIAEKIIKISTKYKSEMTLSDRLCFSRLVEKFEKQD